MNRTLRLALRWIAITSPALVLTACYVLAGLDMSVEGRHKMWIHDKQKLIGEGVFKCAFWYCVDHQRPDLYLGESELENGNKERGFRYGRFDSNKPTRFPQCRYYYEYNPKTGVIVGFRYEESERFACRISGA